MVTTFQPMKTAAFEALWNTEQPALLDRAVRRHPKNDPTPAFDVEVPYLLSILATNRKDGEVQGINQSQAAEQQQFGDGNYIPVVYFVLGPAGDGLPGSFVLLFTVGLFHVWRKKLATTAVPAGRRLDPAAVHHHAGGWILAETGRQPWIVWGLQQTDRANSPSVGSWRSASPSVFLRSTSCSGPSTSSCCVATPAPTGPSPRAGRRPPPSPSMTD